MADITLKDTSRILYAYVGDVMKMDDFIEINKIIPAIVCLGADEDGRFVLGVSNSLSDKEIGFIQLAVSVFFADKETYQQVWDVFM